MSISSVNINPTASIVLGFSKGGNTATGVKPLGTSANESARVGIRMFVGKPPPPRAPTGVDPTGAEPDCYKSLLKVRLEYYLFFKPQGTVQIFRFKSFNFWTPTTL